jgi:hypothetical protein
MATSIKVGEVIKTETLPLVESFVQPSELCEIQRKSMAHDAFSALQSKGF